MCQRMRLFIIVFLVLPFIGCNSNNNQDNTNTPNLDVTLNDFIGVMKIASNSINSNGTINTAGFFPDNTNNQVKVRGTNKTLLVDQDHLDTALADVPEYISITLVTRTDNNNGDITFEGQVFLTKKSLITDIKQAIASDPKEIEQSTIDAKKFALLFENISFTTTFHRFNDSYIQPNEEDEYDPNRPVLVKDTTYALFAPKRHLDADAQTLPDQVIVYLADLGQGLGSQIQTELNVSGQFVMVPKSVIADVKTALTSNPAGTVERDDNTWHPLVSFTINLEFMIPST